MIYEKFPVVFLSTFLSEKEDSTNAVIARYILAHFREMQDITIKQVAKDCNVGLGSVSRFCKDIGLSDFAELRELIGSDTISAIPLHRQQTDRERFSAWIDAVTESLRLVGQSVDPEKIRRLCADIRRYEKVSAFGMLKAQAAATDLQADMLMLGKNIYSCVAYADQISHILAAGKDELIIIFSYTGSYFDYPDLRPHAKRLALPKIWMICGTDKKPPAFVNETITFASRQDHAGHPFQLEAVESLIAREYAEEKAS